jgi:hypothetical protein
LERLAFDSGAPLASRETSVAAARIPSTRPVGRTFTTPHLFELSEYAYQEMGLLSGKFTDPLDDSNSVAVDE